MKSVATGSGLSLGIAGESGSFNIEGVDQFGNSIIYGGASFILEFPCVTNFNYNVTDHNNGSYSVEYITNEAASCNLTILLQNATGNNDNLPISQSPFSLTITPNIPFPGTSVAIETGTDTGLSGSGIAGTTLTFHVQLKDAYDNIISSLPNPPQGLNATLSISINSLPSSVILGTLNPTPGTFGFNYSETKVGNYSLFISLNGLPIINPSFNIIILPAAVNAVNSSIFGTDINNGIAGFPETFFLQLKGKKI